MVFAPFWLRRIGIPIVPRLRRSLLNVNPYPRPYSDPPLAKQASPKRNMKGRPSL
jgi:hypothetical protein